MGRLQFCDETVTNQRLTPRSMSGHPAGPLSFVSLVVLSVLIACPVPAQDDIYTPKPVVTPDQPSPQPKETKGSATALGGTWIADVKGKATCHPGVILKFTSKTAGTTQWSNLTGTFNAQVSGRSFKFFLSYKDLLGNTANETYVGEVSEDGRSGSGTVVGGWGDGCTFVMARP